MSKKFTIVTADSDFLDLAKSRGAPPKGLQFPTCQTMNTQAPHAETNQDTWPHHFYRLEFLCVDGKDIQDHWKEWYPYMLEPLVMSKQVFDALSKKQQDVIMALGAEMEGFGTTESQSDDRAGGCIIHDRMPLHGAR